MARTWLITGGSQGLGKALTLAALGAGDRVAVTSRNPHSLTDLTREYPERLLPLLLDVTSPEACRDVVAATVDKFGSLDVVINNAGYAASSSVEDFPEDEFRAQVDANLYGTINVTRAALPVLRRQRAGHIVQISSIGGRVGGTPGLSAYQTAKFGVEGFSEVLANEVAPLGIKVTIVEPGGIRTGWAAGAATASGQLSEGYEQTVGAWLERFAAYAGNEPGDPARMAKAIVDILDVPEPPRRLLLGSDALEIALNSGEERNTEARTWAEVSRSTDHPVKS
ncbi:NADP-dependent 3-hydroxy acid dehydrogenase YdfG [Micromonospora violae]|uniref:NADP-dependent 3-hydroxy acid dehydrogenase YdfG n=1 Tax=Micromonospora violae TaxID=1278207 RepID=A0A4V2FP91_9ACTN|nr:SDR family NAD(P)-dependent oxidoreductase [Micromonospora violae]RZT79670.1 NADP-dependent 3-hydroxy acid dehydrogenase YdfG [Micromonospora violae]